MNLKMKLFCISVFASAIFLSISAQSSNCLDDFDLDDIQSYTYRIPNSDQQKDPHFWDHQQLNYYVFGKFGTSTGHKETKITAGVYNDDKLIYETEIDCTEKTYSNRILNRKSQVEQIFQGKLDTSCTAGEPFDLILKVNNFNAMSWIFNAQALQYGVKEFRKRLLNVKTAVRGDTFEKVAYVYGLKRPMTKVNSKYHAYLATKFVVKASGNARFDRLVFGQCNAWPKGMESRCQDVRTWLHARSKANLTESTLKEHLKNFPYDVNVTRGLGVFGNNRLVHNPLCITPKYFHFQQTLIHPDRNIPITPDLRSMRAYCCCTNMKTGQVLNDDPANNCQFSPQCLAGTVSCQRAFDRTIAVEISRELERLEEQEEEEDKEKVSDPLKEHVDTESKLAAVLHENNTDWSTGVLGENIQP